MLARRDGALVLSCDVDFGSSGAPVFADVDGEPQIVSVVSAKAMIRGRKVSLGTNLEKPLDELVDMMASGDAVLKRRYDNGETSVCRGRQWSGAFWGRFRREIREALAP